MILFRNISNQDFSNGASTRRKKSNVCDAR